MQTPPDLTPDIRAFRVVDSTNAEALRSIEGGSIDGPTVFLAEEQTQGEGRHGRSWHSPAGGLWLTMAWPAADDELPAILEGLGLRLGLACLNTVEAGLAGIGQRAALRWPNDILLEDRKVCGTMCRVVRKDGRGWLLAAAGMNVNNPVSSLPDELRPGSASLNEFAGKDLDLTKVASRLIGALHSALNSRGLTEQDLSFARARLAHRGVERSFRQAGRPAILGTVLGLDEQGRLTIRTGGREVALEGDVVTEAPPGV